jgi:DNA-binding response OmpR family regulator
MSGIRSLLELSFADAGYDVRIAADAAQAMELCGVESFDAVLSDVRMPGMSGHELARWLARCHPATQLFLMTGWDTNCEDCPIAGRCSIVAKPFLPNEVVSRVDAALERG